MATREERKAATARRRAERIGEENSRYEENYRRQERANKAAAAEESGYGLLHLGCTPATPDGVTTLEEELSGAIYWHKLLKMSPVVPGSTLFDELNQQFYEFVRQGARLWNPISGAWSSSWYFEPKGKTFAKSFTVLEGTKELILNPAEFSDGAEKED